MWRLGGNRQFILVMRSERKREIDLYRRYSSHNDFKRGMHSALMRMMDQFMTLARNPRDNLVTDNTSVRIEQLA